MTQINLPFDGTQACLDVDPDLFFPETGEDKDFYDPNKLAKAKAICNSCALVASCLEYALIQTDLVGIWGATEEDERRRIRRRVRRRKVNSAA